jgi:hypothetical protein
LLNPATGIAAAIVTLLLIKSLRFVFMISKFLNIKSDNQVSCKF